MHNKKPTIYLVAVDMDGTLLHNDKSISDYTINVLRKIVEKGILLVPASGRPLNGMKAAVLNNVKGIKYAICSNGAMLMDVQKEKSISETGIPIEKALEALTYLEQFPVAVYVHTDRGTFRAEGWEKTGLSEKYPYIRFSEGNVKNLREFLRTSRVNVMKMGAYILTDNLAQKLLEKGSPIPGIAFLRSGDGIIELNSTNASKGNALCILCEKLGIQLENVLAIGDNENDISMLQAAGISAAMENAEDDVKQAAKFVAGNNEEDGAAHFLGEYEKISVNKILL
ncbi:MAG: Cof-type HAD-IIB family hydrolase [Roseburia inulinivorans]